MKIQGVTAGWHGAPWAVTGSLGGGGELCDATIKSEQMLFGTQGGSDNCVMFVCLFLFLSHCNKIQINTRYIYIQDQMLIQYINISGVTQTLLSVSPRWN
uniref:Uncharacterized protein n=1 Tax=Xenopus tropicalis TaxID=8364 RepID=A0A1B8YAY8_XENTR